MIYVFTLIDKPQMGDLRQRIPPEHKEYLAAMADRMAFDFESRDAAHAWIADEPFTRAGLYASTSVHAFVNLWPQKKGFPEAATR